MNDPPGEFAHKSQKESAISPMKHCVLYFPASHLVVVHLEQEVGDDLYVPASQFWQVLLFVLLKYAVPEHTNPHV